MKKVKINILIIVVIAVVGLLFFGCETSSPMTFNDLVIRAEDVEDIEEGNYSLRYTIDNLERYQRQNSVEVVVAVSDKHNQEISLINNRILYVEKNNTYLVTILLTSGNNSKSHSYTVKGIRTLVSVTFTAGEYDNFDNFIEEVFYGEDLDELPELPEYSPPNDEEIVNSYWTSEDPSELTERLPSQVMTSDITELREDITIYAFYETHLPATYTISFQTFEGTDIDPICAIPYSGIIAPNIPTKENKVFFGWYEDENFTERYFFASNPVMPARNMTLYANWIEQIDNATDKSYFEYEQINDLGWLEIRAKDIANMPKDIVIPRFIDDKPIVEIAPLGFAHCADIETLTIPHTIWQIGTSAFSGRKSAPLDIIDMSLTTITFEQTKELVQIQNHAFSYNKNLISVNIPDSVVTLGKSLFEGCESLIDVTFGEDSNLSVILEDAFMGCSSLENIALPKNLSKIEAQGFFDCTSLKSVTLKSKTVIELRGETNKEYVFGYRDDGIVKRLQITIYVPEESMNLYESFDYYAVYEIQPIDSTGISQ